MALKTSTIVDRLKAASDSGTLVLGPRDSEAIHHEPDGSNLELTDSTTGTVGHGISGAAMRLLELLRPLSEKEKEEAGIVPRR